jgi:hypothetical protein
VILAGCSKVAAGDASSSIRCLYLRILTLPRAFSIGSFAVLLPRFYKRKTSLPQAGFSLLFSWGIFLALFNLTMSHFKTFHHKVYKGEQNAKNKVFLRVPSCSLWFRTLVLVLI